MLMLALFHAYDDSIKILCGLLHVQRRHQDSTFALYCKTETSSRTNTFAVFDFRKNFHPRKYLGEKIFNFYTCTVSRMKISAENQNPRKPRMFPSANNC